MIPDLGNTELRHRNKYISAIPPALLPHMEALYAKLQPGIIKKEAVDMLVKEITVPAGFTRGCVYLVEPDTLTLVPRLFIGAAQAAEYQSVSYATATSPTSSIVAAFRSSAPVAGERDTGSDTKPCYIAGCIGDIRKAGVLYLEISDALLKDAGSYPIACFKAIRQAFNDCLDLT